MSHHQNQRHEKENSSHHHHHHHQSSHQQQQHNHKPVPPPSKRIQNEETAPIPKQPLEDNTKLRTDVIIVDRQFELSPKKKHKKNHHESNGDVMHFKQSTGLEYSSSGLYATRKVLSHVVGVSSGHNHNHESHPIPDGFILTLDKRGNPFLIKREEMYLMSNKKRREEWLKLGMGSCTPMSKLAEVFGEGIYVYFDFLTFIAFCNFVLFLPLLISIVPHILNDGFKKRGSPREMLASLYISSYSYDLYPYWIASNVIAVFFSFLFGPIFSLRLKSQFKKLFNHHDHEDKFKDQTLDIIRRKDGSPKNGPGIALIIRTVLCYLMFLCLLVSSTVVFGLLNIGGLVFSNNILYSIAIAAFVMITNSLCWKLCEILTNLEGHYTWTDHRHHLLIKYYVYKVINIAIIFVSRYVIHLYKDWVLQNITIYGYFSSGVSSSTTGMCTLSIDAEQFLLLIIIELTATRAACVLGPWIYYKLWSLCHEVSPTSDRGRPDFDIATEYLQVLYKQFLIYLGMTIFPWIVVLGIIGNIIDYPINKWYLLHISRTPPILRGSMRSFLVFFMFLTSVLSVLMFPQGVVWVLSGFTYKNDCSSTSIFGTSNSNLTSSIDRFM